MKNLRFVSALLVVALAASFVSACGTSSKQLKINLITPVVGHPYWAPADEGMEAAGKELNIDVNHIGPQDVNMDEIAKAIEASMAAKVDGIMINPGNPEATGPAIDKAVDAGIVVITIDTDAPNTKRLAYLGTSNRNAGAEAGKALAKATGGKAVVGILTGALDAYNLNERIDGFEEAIKDQPDMKVVALEGTNSDLMVAVDKAKAMLRADPTINAFFGVSASDILGAAKAVEELNLVGKVTLIGFDDLPETLDYIKSGVAYATIAQKPYTMAYRGVYLINDIVKEKKYPAQKIIDTGVVVVTKDNVDSYKTGQ